MLGLMELFNYVYFSSFLVNFCILYIVIRSISRYIFVLTSIYRERLDIYEQAEKFKDEVGSVKIITDKGVEFDNDLD